MSKNSLLDIYRSKNSVFTFSDISLIWKNTDKDLVKSRINYYVKTKKLYPLRRGIYAKDKNYNKLELATKIFTPSYISLETVLQKEGVVFQHQEKIFVVSYLSRDIVCDDQVYSYKKIKDFVLNNHAGIEKRGNYDIATKERAFMDIIYLYKDYHFDNLGSVDWQKCFDLIDIYNNKTMKQKLRSYQKDAQY